jgi:hypothetical protein
VVGTQEMWHFLYIKTKMQVTMMCQKSSSLSCDRSLASSKLSSRVYHKDEIHVTVNKVNLEEKASGCDCNIHMSRLDLKDERLQSYYVI